MTAPAGIDTENAEPIVAGVLDILRSGQGPEESVDWANACTGSGLCLSACDDGVNPRFMLALARIAMQRESGGPKAVRAAGAGRFRHMSRGVKVLSRLQLSPALLQRLGQLRVTADDEDQAPDVVFYTGCNVLKTPHIALLCLDVMDALGVRYQVSGGPSYCCGVYSFQAGDTDGFARITTNTIDRFAATGTGEVLSWCPSCQVHLGEAALGTYDHMGGAPFALTPFVAYLEQRIDDLRPLFAHRVEKRVGLHEHPGVGGVSEAARRILEAIPGLDFVDLAQPRVGSMCNTLSALPDYKREVHAQQLAAAEDAGVTTLAGIYHACHRELCSHERDWPFEVVNFMELVGESMGISHPDLFKRLKIMQDVDAVVEDTADMIAAYDLKIDQVREVILKDLLGEQAVPLGHGSP